MRVLALMVGLIACGDDDSGNIGRAQDAPASVDADQTCSAEASGLCASGPMCGGGCCDAGERCDNGTCMCGDMAACSDGDYCSTGGPVLPSHGCGLFCCGPVSGVGCPI